MFVYSQFHATWSGSDYHRGHDEMIQSNPAWYVWPSKCTGELKGWVREATCNTCTKQKVHNVHRGMFDVQTDCRLELKPNQAQFHQHYLLASSMMNAFGFLTLIFFKHCNMTVLFGLGWNQQTARFGSQETMQSHAAHGCTSLWPNYLKHRQGAP